jgi:hypothetical protein
MLETQTARARSDRREGDAAKIAIVQSRRSTLRIAPRRLTPVLGAFASGDRPIDRNRLCGESLWTNDLPDHRAHRVPRIAGHFSDAY